MIKSKNVWSGLYAISKKHKPKELKKVIKLEPENNLNPRPYVVWIKDIKFPFSCKNFDFYFYGIKVKIDKLYEFVMNEKGDKMVAVLNGEYYKKLIPSLAHYIKFLEVLIWNDKNYIHPNKYKHGWIPISYLTKTFEITKEIVDLIILLQKNNTYRYNINETKVYIGED